VLANIAKVLDASLPELLGAVPGAARDQELAVCAERGSSQHARRGDEPVHWYTRRVNHFTDKEGYNAIRSQPDWLFKAVQPRAKQNPVGAYFTDYPPNEPNLAKKIFVPRDKLAFVFQFTPPSPLLSLPGNRGRLGRIFYSPVDYRVPEDSPNRQAGATGL
jgi:hypothetical protein